MEILGTLEGILIIYLLKHFYIEFDGIYVDGVRFLKEKCDVFKNFQNFFKIKFQNPTQKFRSVSSNTCKGDQKQGIFIY